MDSRPRLALTVGLPAAALFLALAPAGQAASLRGTVSAVGENGKKAPRGADVSLAVVSFTPVGGVGRAAPPGRFEMATRGKRFDPQVLAVPRGSEVRFPNFDPILHNVFSVSGRNRFDLGLYGRGAGESHRFDHAGLVRVYCNVHHPMIGYILVLETPHFTVVEADGSYRLDGLPAGGGRLELWHPQAEEQAVEVARAQSVADLDLVITRRRIPPHLNKFGKAYRSGRRNRYDG